MKYLARLRDRWADFQDRHTLGAASAVLVLDGGRLFSVSGTTEAECDPSSCDSVAQAALSFGLEADARVILLLPPGHFSTSEHQFATLDRGALLRALHFQQDELFPGMEPLVVTAAGSPTSLALWMRRGELERWQQAFALAGLKLLAVGPSNLLHQYMGATGFSSLDSESMLEATVDPLGNLSGWSLKESAEGNGGGDGDQASSSWKGFKGRWRIRRPDYLFLLERSNNRPRLGLWLGLAAIVVGGLLVTYAVLPLAQQLNLRADLEQQVADLRQQAGDVLTLREQMLALEEHLAPVLNYPKIDIGSLLILMDQNLPKKSWLLNMRVAESIVEIEGVSPDPSRIIELLSVRSEFSEVAFSKAIQQDLRYGGSEGKSRFGIRLKLAGIDFDGWRESVRKKDE